MLASAARRVVLHGGEDSGPEERGVVLVVVGRRRGVCVRLEAFGGTDVQPVSEGGGRRKRGILVEDG